MAMSSFGKANRTQTPVKGIINNDYGLEAESFYRQRQEESFNRVSKLPLTLLHRLGCRLLQRNGQIKKPRMHIGSTRAQEMSSYLNRQKIEDDRMSQNPKELFKMKRFAEVGSKVDHSRSQLLNKGSSFASKSKSNAINTVP